MIRSGTRRAYGLATVGFAATILVVTASASRGAAPVATVGPSAPTPDGKDRALDEYLACRGSKPPRECEGLRSYAVEVLRDDVLLLGSSADPAHLPPLAKLLASDAAELRAAAADAIGMIKPTAAEVPALAVALDDPVPAVRGAALRALEQSNDPAAGRLVKRAPRDQGKALKPDPVPDAKATGGTPLYAGAKYLYFASQPAKGLLVFTTPDPPAKVTAFYAGGAQKRQAISLDQLSDAYAKLPEERFRAEQKQKAADVQAMAKGAEQKRAEADAQAMAKEAKEIMAGMKPGQMPNPEQMRKLMELSQRAQAGSAPNMANMQQELQTRSQAMADLQRQGYMPPGDVAEYAKEFGDEARYGSPTAVVLSETQTPYGPAPLRLAVVYEDHLLGQTGIALRVPPPTPQAPAMPKSP
jgi:hypothetical protein